MALERVSKILKMADAANTSVIAFNCTDYNMVYSVVTVAEEQNKPVIVTLYPEHAYLNNASQPSAFAGMAKALAESVNVPVGIHLDHSSDYNFILGAIRGGFTSVMYDGSMLPLEENIRLTKTIVDIAHKLGVDVEAELGHIGFAVNSAGEALDSYTQPDIAARFCRETNVDSIAVAIGSAHGFYKKIPKLDLVRLEEINAATDVPLVLHGGSGIPADQLKIAFTKGINKFNVGTEFFHLYYHAIKDYCAETGDNGNVFDMPQYAQEKMMAYLRKKLLLTKM